MRGRLSGLGARMSMVSDIKEFSVHRTDHSVDECNLIVCDGVLLVELLVGPVLVPLLLWHPAIDALHCVLAYLPQRYEESDKRGLKVTGNDICLLLRFERPGNDPRLRADRVRFSNTGLTKNHV